jgi:hypothetical protein
MSYITIGSETLNQTQIRDRLSENGMYLQFIDDVTYADCKKAVGENYAAFQFVPPNLQNVELCRLALIGTDFSMLKYIMRFDDPAIVDLCFDIVPPILLPTLINSYINDPSEEICCKFVKKDPKNIQYLKREKRSPKVCDIVIESLGEHPKLISSIPDLTTDMLKRAVEVNRESVRYIDFARYRIASLYDDNTKKLHDLYPLAKIDSESIDNYATTRISIDKRQKDSFSICYENVKDGTMHLVNDVDDIIEEIHKYIQTRYGNKNLEYVKKCMIEGRGSDAIQNDPTFIEGIFYQKTENGKYELFKKTTSYQNDGWVFGSKLVAKPIIEKIRIYSVIKI